MTSNQNHKRTLIAVGYWFSDREPNLPFPQTYENDKISSQDRQALINYLYKGKRLHEWMGYSGCRYDCGIESHKMGNACLTDGKYIWPEGLHHYISKHNVWLPDAFIEYSRENKGYQTNQVLTSESNFANYDWWTSLTKS